MTTGKPNGQREQTMCKCNIVDCVTAYKTKESKSILQILGAKNYSIYLLHQPKYQNMQRVL